MKTKHLSALLVTGAISLGASPAIAESSDAPQLNFDCQVNNGVPTTVAQYVGSEETLPVFTWKQEALAYRVTSTPQQLCNNVTTKLEEYSAQGYDLSEVSFVATNISDGLPSICANTSGGRGCTKVLFTLNASDQSAVEAQNLISAILNPKLQGQETVFNDRGVQSTSYQVNFWDLFNLGPNKLFGKVKY